jgi:hypothetical protein
MLERLIWPVADVMSMDARAPTNCLLSTLSCQTLSSEAAILGGASGQSRGQGCDSSRSYA